MWLLDWWCVANVMWHQTRRQMVQAVVRFNEAVVSCAPLLGLYPEPQPWDVAFPMYVGLGWMLCIPQ